MLVFLSFVLYLDRDPDGDALTVDLSPASTSARVRLTVAPTERGRAQHRLHSLWLQMVFPLLSLLDDPFAPRSDGFPPFSFHLL